MDDLQVTDVSKSYPTPAAPLEVLRGCSLSLALGQSVAVLGNSGSGKSTLLAIIGTLDRPTTGEVTLLGQRPFDLAERELAAFRGQKIGFVFQDHHLLPQCNVLENVLIPTIAVGAASAAAIDRAKWLIDRVGLTDRSSHRPAELSGGERQRTAIARALVNQPALLLADEPTGNLDRSTASTIAGLLADLQRQEHSMLIVVTHSQELAERMDRRLRLEDGRLEVA